MDKHTIFAALAVLGTGALVGCQKTSADVTEVPAFSGADAAAEAPAAGEGSCGEGNCGGEAAPEAAEASCGEAGCGGSPDAEAETVAEANESPKELGAEPDQQAVADAAEPDTPKAPAKKKKKKKKKAVEEACGEGTCA